MTHTTPDPRTLLRGAGLRVTQPRVAVLSALAEHPHASAEVVIAAVRRQVNVSVQAVYDVLNTLTTQGLIRRIRPAGSVARYELRIADNHHHLVCRRCGAVVDVDCARGAAPCLDPDNDSGFVIDEAEVTWWGVCPACQHIDDPTTARSDNA